MLLSLTNSNADVGVRLDSAQRKISTYSDVQAEFAARDEDNNVSSGGWRWCLKLLPAGKRHPGEWPQARCEAPDDRGAFIPQTGVAREISLGAHQDAPHRDYRFKFNSSSMFSSSNLHMRC